ncbi:MAG: DUF3179 domain-containing protein [Chloroflexi bacterium]|nr:DUF3179 domain-containing protein [Chloroflexota bacterium]
MIKKQILFWGVWVLISLSACTIKSIPDELQVEYTPSGRENIPIESTPSGRENIPIESTHSINGWNQLLPFDGIKPVYDPQFIPPGEANLQGSELIMGVAWNGEAKAYPVTVLHRREMVNDEMAGVPYLVSW